MIQVQVKIFWNGWYKDQKGNRLTLNEFNVLIHNQRWQVSSIMGDSIFGVWMYIAFYKCRVEVKGLRTLNLHSCYEAVGILTADVHRPLIIIPLELSNQVMFPTFGQQSQLRHARFGNTQPFTTLA